MFGCLMETFLIVLCIFTYEHKFEKSIYKLLRTHREVTFVIQMAKKAESLVEFDK